LWLKSREVTDGSFVSNSFKIEKSKDLIFRATPRGEFLGEGGFIAATHILEDGAAFIKDLITSREGSSHSRTK
jgi:hypothetical protein